VKIGEYLERQKELSGFRILAGYSNNVTSVLCEKPRNAM
jgi:hypothetical protein